MKKIILLLLLVIISCTGKEKKKLVLEKKSKIAYSVFVKDIITKRDVLSEKYTKSVNSEEKKEVIKEARLFLVNTIATEIFPYWYGTKWSFSGMTRTPQKGRIACGYFITNVLTDVGFNIPRIKWAQSASEVFIKILSKKEIKRFMNKPITDVEEYLINSGNGLYLVGLDSHTGFIYVHQDKVRFIHADYYEPEKGVVSEKLNSYSPIAHSKYRVIGKLMSDQMIISWLKNERIS